MISFFFLLAIAENKSQGNLLLGSLGLYFWNLC